MDVADAQSFAEALLGLIWPHAKIGEASLKRFTLKVGSRGFFLGRPCRRVTMAVTGLSANEIGCARISIMARSRGSTNRRVSPLGWRYFRPPKSTRPPWLGVHNK